MANIALNAANAPSPARQTAAQNSTQSADDAGQVSFANLLQARSANQSASASNGNQPAQQSQNTATQTPAKPADGSTGKTSADNAKSAQDKASTGDQAAAQNTTTDPTQAGINPQLAAMLAALNTGKTTPTQDQSAAVAATTMPNTNPLANLLANGKTTATGETQTANPLGTPASSTASTAAGTASIADAAGKNADGKSGKEDKSPAFGSDPKQAVELGAATAKDGSDAKAAATTTDTSFTDALAAAQRNTAQHTTTAAPLNTAAHGTEVPQQVVRTPVGSPGWAEEVGQRVSWTASHDSGRADLVLTPPSMGRVEVSINMNGDQASANFVAANPQAREALQDALPKLREMLAQAGIQLGQANVSAGQQGQSQLAQQGQGNGGGRSSYSGATTGGVDAGATTSRTAWVRQGQGVVDTFA